MGADAAPRRSHLRRRILSAAALLILAAGCASPSDETVPPTHPPETGAPPPTAPDGTPSAATQPTEPADRESAMPIEPGLESLVASAVQDLAARTGAMPDDIEIVSAKTVVWPDSSRGCPHPDMRYLQVPVDGALIELQLEGRTYRYHAGGADPDPFLCEHPSRTTRS